VGVPAHDDLKACGLWIQVEALAIVKDVDIGSRQLDHGSCRERLTPGLRVYVAANCVHWSNRVQLIENAAISNVASVNDTLATLQRRESFRAEQPMSVRDEAKNKGVHSRRLHESLGRFLAAVLVSFSFALCLHAQPQVDYHQHLFSPNIAKLAPALKPLTATDLIALLDKAGIRRAVVLSVAYQFSNPNKPRVEDEYAKVMEENDWTAQQVALYPERLRGFCSVNPLKEYALGEIERCAKDSQLHFGLKLHFGNSDVQLDDPHHVEKVKQVFSAANAHGMAIVVHMRSSITKKRPYGGAQARIFLDEILPSAPDVPVQIAHLAGSGSYDAPAVDEALSVFVDAIAKNDPRMNHVYFDVSGVAGYGEWEQKAELIAKRIRQLGTKRVLFGSDGFGGGNLAPVEAWAAFRRLPLSDDEVHVIETNSAPYLR
jgi:predicted TIM-barrel fold metal-dependent hydrolase